MPKLCHRAVATDQKFHNTDFTAGKVWALSCKLCAFLGKRAFIWAAEFIFINDLARWPLFRFARVEVSESKIKKKDGYNDCRI